jgi:hypothetical protein
MQPLSHVEVAAFPDELGGHIDRPSEGCGIMTLTQKARGHTVGWIFDENSAPNPGHAGDGYCRP